MEPSPDVIVITATHEEQVAAEGAELLVTVQGSSLVTSHTALKKAKEVSKLVEDLEKCGVSHEQIGLESIHAEVSSGILGKSSSAKYRLRIRWDNLEQLPDILGAVTSAKNSELDEVVWRYPESIAVQSKWLQASIAAANLKALAAAEALGTRVVGIRRFTESGLDEATHQVQPFRGDMVRSRTSSAIALGFELTHQKRRGVRVTVEYRVEGFCSPVKPAT